MQPLVRSTLFLSLLCAPVAAQCGGSTANISTETDVVDTAVAAGSFKTLVAAVKHAGLVEALKGDGPFTVFAPSDEAFAKLPAGTLKSLLKPENRSTLQAILTYHVVPGRLDAKAVTGQATAATLNGQRLAFSAGQGVQVSGANVVKADIHCTNGVIHVIDKVLLPNTDSVLATAGKAGQFGTLAAAIKAAGLVEALEGKGPFTVFAPTDAAFAKLPAGTVESLLEPENKAKLVEILKLHVVSGRVYSDQALEAGKATSLAGAKLSIGVAKGVARVSGSKLIKTDIDAANGVIHVIDEVILPGSTEVSSACPARSLIDLAIERGAPLYNTGNPGACAAVYEVALRGLLNLGGERMPTSLRLHLQQSLQQNGDDRERAWSLRRALDRTSAALERAAQQGNPHAQRPKGQGTRTFF